MRALLPKILSHTSYLFNINEIILMTYRFFPRLRRHPIKGSRTTVPVNKINYCSN